MRRTTTAAALAALALLVARGADAQVGSLPENSPYRDLATRHEVSLIAGYFIADKEPSGAAPKGAPLVGAHYEWRPSGPVAITGELAYVAATRDYIDPTEPAATRNHGSRSWPLLAGDAGISLNLTGPKSWRNIVPQVHGGLGFVTDFRTRVDSGGFAFGTRFAFSAGAGARWLATERLAVRGDLRARLYTVSYPESYFRTPEGGGAPVLPLSTGTKVWTINPAVTLGVAYHFGR